MPRYNSQVDALGEVDENILRRIQSIHRERRNATAAELAVMTGMTTSSVYTSIRRLELSGDIEETPAEKGHGRGRHRYDIKLTPHGEERAAKILERHDLVLSWLKRLGVPEEDAEDEACHMEHGLTDNTLHVIKTHVEKAMLQMSRLGGTQCTEVPAMPQGVMELIQLAGASENVATLANEIRENGGVESTLQQLKLLRELEKNYGGAENLMISLDLLKRIGDFQSLTLLLGMLESGGGTATFIELFEKERRVWTNYLTRAT